MVCPSCGSEYREGWTECADCKVPLVESLSVDAEPKRRWPRFPTVPKSPWQDRRPLLLRMVSCLAFLCGAGLILVLAIGLLGDIYFVNGRVVSQEEYLSAATPPLLGLALVAFAIAFAIATERRWGRPLLMLALMLPVVGDLWWGTANPSWFEVDFFGLGKISLSAVGVLLLAAWYLYAKPNVRDYYRALKNAGA